MSARVLSVVVVAFALLVAPSSAQGQASLPAVGPACDEATLGPEEQLIVRRSLYEGASCRQLAAELGLADHTAVAAWRREILARLRHLLGDRE